MKPKAPRWLTEAFRDGVDDRQAALYTATTRPQRAYPKAETDCWLAQFDPVRLPCVGPLERFHFIPRQQVENAMWEALRGAVILHPAIPEERFSLAPPTELLQGPRFEAAMMTRDDIWDVILLAAWDPRNGGLGCEGGHHRRFDGHSGPKLIIDGCDVPSHVFDFAIGYGLESQFVERFGGTQVMGRPDDPFIVT